MNKYFINGFNKHAGLAGTLGNLAGKAKNIPAVVGGAVHAAPAMAKAVGKDIKGGILARQREFAVSKNRALGPSGRIGAGTSLKGKSPDLSHAAPGARVTTGKESPAAIKRDKGSFLGNARNVATAGTIAAGVGVSMGMKDKDENQQRY